jgi:hypothetical protein
VGGICELGMDGCFTCANHLSHSRTRTPYGRSFCFTIETNGSECFFNAVKMMAIRNRILWIISCSSQFNIKPITILLNSGKASPVI